VNVNRVSETSTPAKNVVQDFVKNASSGAKIAPCSGVSCAVMYMEIVNGVTSMKVKINLCMCGSGEMDIFVCKVCEAKICKKCVVWCEFCSNFLCPSCEELHSECRRDYEVELYNLKEAIREGLKNRK